jgi:HEAT repeat protein
MAMIGLMAVVLPVYLSVLGGTDFEARNAAMDSLVSSGDIDGVALSVYESGWFAREGLIVVLERMGVDAAPALIDIATHHPKVDAQRLAIRSLGRVGGKMARDVLVTMIHGPHRDLAVEGLGQVGDSSVVSVIKPLLKDEWPDVRRRAALALIAREGVAALDVVIPMLSDGHHGVRFAVAEALTGVGEPVAEGLAKHYASLSWAGRFLALRLIGQLGHPVSVLTAALQEEDWALRAAAVDNIGLLGKTDLQSILKKALNRESHPVVRLRLVQTINRLSP